MTRNLFSQCSFLFLMKSFPGRSILRQLDEFFITLLCSVLPAFEITAQRARDENKCGLYFILDCSNDDKEMNTSNSTIIPTKIVSLLLKMIIQQMRAPLLRFADVRNLPNAFDGFFSIIYSKIC